MNNPNYPISQATKARICQHIEAGIDKSLDMAINEVIDRLDQLEQQSVARKTTGVATSSPKAHLSPCRLAVLVARGQIREGQKLVFCERNGTPILGAVGKYEATVKGNKLTYNGTDYSMSVLAKGLAQRCGRSAANYAQGTPHWLDEASGRTVWEIWRGDKTIL